MADLPETRYARAIGGGDVAYQVVGDGAIDVLVVRSPRFPIDLMWDEPRLAFFLNRMSSFCRHIWFDQSGTGASDGISHAEARLTETLVDDMVAVLDAAEVERAAIVDFAALVTGALFAVAHPDRTSALVEINPVARYRSAEGYPPGLSDAEIDQRLHIATDGVEGAIETHAPGLAGDVRFRRWLGRAERLMTPPGERLWRARTAYDADLRDVLHAVRVPTLVINRRDPSTAGLTRFVAEHIEGARYVEVPGADLFPFVFPFVGDTGALLDAIEEFLTGKLAPPPVDRVLATVLFTDVVNSTPTAAALGDRRWSELLATHDALVGEEVERFRGRAVKFTGDGVLATFDGPARAIRCACAIRDSLQPLGIEVRAGLHSGEIELRGDDVAGITIHIAQRVASTAGAGEVLVSRTVADLLAGSEMKFDDLGEHELKGVSGAWRLFSVRDE